MDVLFIVLSLSKNLCFIARTKAGKQVTTIAGTGNRACFSHQHYIYFKY